MVALGIERLPDSYKYLNCLRRVGVGDWRSRGMATTEKDAEAPARMEVVVRPTVWSRRREVGERGIVVVVVIGAVCCEVDI